MNTDYVLLTAAKDEAACIAEVLALVARQTILPRAWYIVDDGSTDRTAAIVEDFAAAHPFVHLHTARARGGRNFGSQYLAIRAADELARSWAVDFVGVQDADQAPAQPDYYESLLLELNRNPRLGAVSGFVHERPRGVWETRPDNSADSLAASALFRRTAFDAVAGYTPLYLGGSDWLMQINLKMAGWQLLTRPDLHLYHYRPTSSAGGLWRGRFRAGMMDASFGSHALFELLKCGRRVMTRPFFLGSVVRYGGFLWWRLRGRKPLLSPGQVAFLRREQMEKLRRCLPGWSAPKRALQ